MISYQPDLAAAYGLQFGSLKENGIFKRMGDNDCTNFISQCVWAGYGGTQGYSLTNPNDIEAMRQLVAKNYRQTMAWFGRNYLAKSPLASNAFIQVETFWNYMTHNTGAGPKAKGYNNGKHWSELREKVEKGDVLQFYHKAANRYAHTVIIVSDTSLSIKDAIEQSFNAQHSADFSARRLIDTVAANDGLKDAKIRLLKFQPW